MNSNRVARWCCCKRAKCSPILPLRVRPYRGAGARTRATGRGLWLGLSNGEGPADALAVARACTSAGARCPRIFRSLQREHKASATGQRPITLTRPCRRGPCRRKVGEASRRERGAVSTGPHLRYPPPKTLYTLNATFKLKSYNPNHPQG